MSDYRTTYKALARVDDLLSEAQGVLGKLATAEVRESSPSTYKRVTKVFDEIEKARWRLRERLDRPRARNP